MSSWWCMRSDPSRLLPWQKVVYLPNAAEFTLKGMGKIDRNQTTLKHNKALTVCMILGTYCIHFSDVIMSAMASQITGFSIVYSTVCSCTENTKALNIHSLHIVVYYIMMTSSNGNIFRVTGPLCGDFTGHRWIPLTKASGAELWCFLWFAPEQTVWVNIRDAGDLRRHRAHYDVTVMTEMIQYIPNRQSYLTSVLTVYTTNATMRCVLKNVMY